MDFQRSPQPQSTTPSAHSVNQPASSTSGDRNRGSKHSGDFEQSKLFRITSAVLLFAVALVLVGLLVFLSFSSSNNEGKYIQTDHLQAVFLNTGQVYFGNIKELNNNYVVLQNIFYLQTSSSSSSSTSSSSSSNVSLVKLGCELHAPYDQMVINNSEVTFWENLQPSGQVAKAVQTWEKQNPDGQKCSDQSSAGTSGTSSVQGSTTTPSSTSTSTSSTSSSK